MQSEEIKVKGKHLKESPAVEETPSENQEPMNDNENQEKPRRRKNGVATSVAALLVVLSLVCGCVLGYVGGSAFSPMARRLEDAEAQIAEYETLLAEMYTEEFEEAAQTGIEGFEEPAEPGDGEIAALSGNDIDPAPSSEPVVVAEFNGGVIMSDEAQAAYETALAGYVMQGEDVSDYTSVIMSTVLESMVSEKIAYQKAEELGFTQITDADRAKIAELAEAEYSDVVAFYMDLVWEEGMNEEEAYAAAAEYLELYEGYTIDTVTAEIENSYWAEKLYDSIVANVKVGGEEINAAYSDLLAQQTEAFEASHADFETALMNGDMIVYYPEGYRTVKHILFAFDEEDQAQVDALYAQLAEETDEEAIAEINASLDEIYAPLMAEADDVLAKYNDGGDFDALMSDYSADDELISGYFADTGYYVAADSIMFAQEFVDAAMALALPGDVSAPVRTPGGVHIIRYIANVDSGAVLLSEVSAKMTADTQAAAEEAAVMEQLEAWTLEAEPKYYPENMGL